MNTKGRRGVKVSRAKSAPSKKRPIITPVDAPVPLTGKTRKFDVTVTACLTIEIDQCVFDAVTDEWREHFYNLSSDREVAEFVGRNMARTGRTLGVSFLDGFANLPGDSARVTEDHWDDVEVVEIEAAAARIRS